MGDVFLDHFWLTRRLPVAAKSTMLKLLLRQRTRLLQAIRLHDELFYAADLNIEAVKGLNKHLKNIDNDLKKCVVSKSVDKDDTDVGTENNQDEKSDATPNADNAPVKKYISGSINLKQSWLPESAIEQACSFGYKKRKLRPEGEYALAERAGVPVAQISAKTKMVYSRAQDKLEFNPEDRVKIDDVSDDNSNRFTSSVPGSNKLVVYTPDNIFDDTDPKCAAYEFVRNFDKVATKNNLAPGLSLLCTKSESWYEIESVFESSVKPDSAFNVDAYEVDVLDMLKAPGVKKFLVIAGSDGF